VCGDPQTYTKQRGHPHLKMRHMQWEIDSSMRYYWLNAKFIAMDKIDLDPNVKELMIEYFVKLANHMINND
jgi:hemoglobin